MTAYIPFATEQEAAARSAEFWIAHLGRAKDPEDVTTYLLPRITRSNDPDAEPLPDGVDVAIVVHERDAALDGLIRADQMTPDEVAALVDLYEPWVNTGVNYEADELRSHNGVLWKCIAWHQAQVDREPGIANSLWTHAAPAGTIPVWVAPTGGHDAYALDVLVTWPEGGRVWKSLMNANTGTPGVQGTWRDQSTPPLWVAPTGSIGLWDVDDVVEYGGQVWINTSPNNSFAPGVFGWTVVP